MYSKRVGGDGRTEKKKGIADFARLQLYSSVSYGIVFLLLNLPLNFNIVMIHIMEVAFVFPNSKL